MKLLSTKDIKQVVGGGMMNEIGYKVGYGLGYWFGGGAGRDLGNWIYDSLHSC